MSPTPNTTFLREAARRGHFRETSARARNSESAASLASRPSDAWGGEGESTVSNDSWAGGGFGPEAEPARCGGAMVGSNAGLAGRVLAKEGPGTAGPTREGAAG